MITTTTPAKRMRSAGAPEGRGRSVSCYRTSNIDAAVRRITTMFGPHHIFPYGRRRNLAFEHKHVWLGDVCVNELAYGRELRNDIGEFREQNYCLMLPCNGNYAITVDGKRVEADRNSVTIINPDCPVTLEASDDYRNVSVRISSLALEEVVLRKTGARPAEPICFVPHPQPLAGAAAPLKDLIMQFWSSCAEGEVCMTLGAMGRELESLIASMMLMSVPNNFSTAWAPAVQESMPAAERAAEFLKRHAGEAITLEQVVAASGSNKTSLYAEFRKAYGLSPMEFLRNERLRMARDALESAPPRSASVTGIALECGFQHFSRFAEYYRKAYGELPSETLARNRRRSAGP